MSATAYDMGMLKGQERVTPSHETGSRLYVADALIRGDEMVALGDAQPVGGIHPIVYQMGLGGTADQRKACPIARGVIDYWPDAIACLANVSFVANEQHNPGEPMHWAREKSDDHADCAVRHIAKRGTLDSDGLRHTAKAAWRLLSLLQLEIEAEQSSD